MNEIFVSRNSMMNSQLSVEDSHRKAPVTINLHGKGHGN